MFARRGRESPAIPYQRAVIFHDDGVETLFVQSSFDGIGADAPVGLGWVVPVPAVPELGSMPADDASALFRALGMRSSPRIVRVGPTVLWWGAVVLVLAAIFVLLGSLIVRPLPSWWRARRRLLIITASLVLVGTCSTGFLLPALARAGAGVGVEVLHREQVGLYDVQVVGAEDPRALVAWLDEHGLDYGNADEAAIADHVARGWCFVVAVVDPSAEGVVLRGMLAPLILRFPTERAIYPLALTASGGHDTEVLLHVIAETNVDAGPRLPRRHAGPFDIHLAFHLDAVEPPGFVAAPTRPMRMTTFQRVLTAAQMATDLEIVPAADRGDHRERVWRLW